MAHFYLDENIPVDLAAVLTRFSHDVVHAYDWGNLSISDPQHLSIAADAGRILITYNRRDFEVLHQFWTALNAWGILERSHAGILAPWGQVTPDLWANLVHDFVSQGQSLNNQMWVWWRQQGDWRQFGW
jgi:hypothetical protein